MSADAQWKQYMDLVDVNLILAEWARKDGDKVWHRNYIALAQRNLIKAMECQLPSAAEQQQYIEAKAILQAAE